MLFVMERKIPLLRLFVGPPLLLTGVEAQPPAQRERARDERSHREKGRRTTENLR